MMRHAVIVLAIVAAAVWAYEVNYKTLAAFDRVSALRGRIAEERERLQVLRVEWAYLNRPERLRALATAHNERLGLVPMAPETLQDAMIVPFPSPPPSAGSPASASEPASADSQPAPAPRDGFVAAAIE